MDNGKNLRLFSGATAIITGGASGIGKAISVELADRGAEVIIADLQFGQARKLADGINRKGGKAVAMKLDVTNQKEFEKLVNTTLKRTGRLDYLFNNAGIGINGPALHYKDKDWNYIIDVNLKGVLNGVQAAYKKMVAQGFGHIINTASIAGLVITPGMPGYTMTKHAVVGLSGALRGEAAGFGINVSVLCPGFIRTSILEGGGKFGRAVSIINEKQKKRMAEILEKYKPMDPELFAKKALDMIAKNKAIIVLPEFWKIGWYIQRFAPEFSLKMSQKRYQKMNADLMNLQ